MVDGGVSFPMLSDAGGKIGTIYGVCDEATGVDIRGRFIIDPGFVIRAMEVLPPEAGRNLRELVREIKAFQHGASHGRSDAFGLTARRRQADARSSLGERSAGALEAPGKAAGGPTLVAPDPAASRQEEVQ